MTALQKMCAFGALLALSMPAARANSIPGPACQPGETRSGTVFEMSQVPNTSFIVHLTDSAGNPVGPAAGIPLAGNNIPGDGSAASLPVNQPGLPNNVNQPGACDAWNETILPNPGNGNGGVGIGGSGTGQPGSGVNGNGGTPTTPESSLQIENYSFDSTHNVWVLYNIWTSVDLSLPNGDMLLIPDLYAVDSSGNLNNQELYGLVNLSVYLNDVTCILKICEEPFSLGQAFTIINGQAASLPGMSFSTEPWTFTPSGGFVDPGAYSGNAVAVTDHGLPSVPEPDGGRILAYGLLAIVTLKVRKRAPLYRRKTAQSKA